MNTKCNYILLLNKFLTNSNMENYIKSTEWGLTGKNLPSHECSVGVSAIFIDIN